MVTQVSNCHLIYVHTNLWKLKISLTPKCKGLSNKKLDNNDGWRLASLHFTVGGATSFIFIVHNWFPKQHPPTHPYAILDQ
jgi:hypothetical protein